MAKSNEPFWWTLFGAGGMVAALLMPVTILLTSIGVAAGWITEERLWNLLGHPLTKIYLLVLISLPLFHWAHRFRFTLVDLGLKSARSAIAVLCYGSAVVGTLVTLVLLFWP
jgi:fumarate reductase subunit D